jgi:hypothetical protein
MIVLQNDFKSIVYKTIPYKETSMKIASGALDVNSASEKGPIFCIGDIGGCDPYNGYMPDNRTGDLRYLSTQLQQEISLQNGAVVKRDTASSGSAMLAQPRWFYDKDTQTLVINIVTVNSSSVMGREGIGTVQMELGQTDYQYIKLPSGSKKVYVYYSPGEDSPGKDGPDYHTAWENYFEQTMNMDCISTPPTLACTKDDVSTLVIKRTDIIIRSI